MPGQGMLGSRLDGLRQSRRWGGGWCQDSDRLPSSTSGAPARLGVTCLHWLVGRRYSLGRHPAPQGLLSMEAILAAPLHQPPRNTKNSDRLLWHGTRRVLGRELQALSQAEGMICDCVSFNQHTFFPKHKVNVEG